MGLRRLFFDIETSPCLGWFWRPSFKMSLCYHNIIEQAKIICICYKWEGSPKIYSLSWDSKQCDKKMLRDFVKVMNQADEVIGHNSDKFDTKWIRTRCLFHGLPMLPEYTSIDTLKAARSGFNFPNNKLDSIGRYTGVGKKIKTTEELWYDVWRKNCKRSLAGMVKYCKQDVILLEAVFSKLNPYIKHKTALSEYKCKCPKCASERVGVVNYRISAAGIKYVNLQCKDCGAYNKVTATSYNKALKDRKKK